MIGAIVLTLRHRASAKRQDPIKQVGRKASETLKVVKVKSGQGL
jgi:NADH-quinone oxidoreductase subunit J